MEKLGLVLAGGGGKGAYEVGVWQALRELGLETSVAAVSGTSVGALNAALFAAGDLERARSVWRALSPTHVVFSPDQEKAEAQIAQLLSSPGLGQRLRDFLHGSTAPFESFQVRPRLRRSRRLGRPLFSAGPPDPHPLSAASCPALSQPTGWAR